MKEIIVSDHYNEVDIIIINNQSNDSYSNVDFNINCKVIIKTHRIFATP